MSTPTRSCDLAKGTCPEHPEACPMECLYWAKSEAVHRKALAGMCVILGCKADAESPAEVCGEHLAALHNQRLRRQT